MSYAIYKGETNIKDLVTRVFRLPDKTAKTAKAAGDALIQANPQLKDMSKMKPGAVLAIPAGAPPVNPGEEAPPSTSRQVAVTLLAQQSLLQASDRLSDIDARAALAADAFVALAQSKQAQALVAKTPELKDQLSALLTTSQSLKKFTTAVPDAHSSAVNELRTALSGASSASK